MAFNQHDDYHAIIWFEEALKLLQWEDQPSSIEETEILDYLSDSLSQKKFYGRAAVLMRRRLELDPDDKEAAKNLAADEAKMEELRESGEGEDWMFNETDWTPSKVQRNISTYADAQYEALCRGENNVAVSAGSISWVLRV